MQVYDQSPQLRLSMRMLELVSALGLIFCLLNMTADSTTFMVYASWFAVAIASAEAILNYFKAGVYALVIATTVLTLMELASNTATLGGATLAVILFFIIYVYIMPEWKRFE